MCERDKRTHWDFLSAEPRGEAVVAALWKPISTFDSHPALAAHPLGSVLPTTIQAWVKGLSINDEDRGRTALAPATVGLVYNVTATVFRAAVRDREPAKTPFRVRLPQVEEARLEPLTTDQVDVLAYGLPPELRAVAILAAGTGMRETEVLRLTRDRLPARQEP